MSNNFPPFSVLMSIYKDDKPEFLEESLQSIVRQTVIPTEIILVEDGPLPTILHDVIEKFKLTPKTAVISVILSENLGLGSALSKGTKYVTTNLIARMDSDDISLSNRFEKQLIEFAKDDKLAVLGGQIAEFEDSSDNIINYRYVPITESSIRKFAKFRSPFNHPSVMMRKNFLMEAGGYQKFRKLEDYHLWVRFLLCKDLHVLNVSDILVYMRVDSGLYGRRGGFKYLKQYFKLRFLFYKWKFIKFHEFLFSFLAMIISSLMPVMARKFLYRKILRKN